MYRVTKTFGHELGLSAAFRQWKAKGHCRFVHGYALSFAITFEAATLDECNWVIDFGGLKAIKQMLVDTFDHKLLVAENDPQYEAMVALGLAGLADVNVMPAVGCEAFANVVYNNIWHWLQTAHGERVRLVSVEVKEHGANSALYYGGS